MPPFRSMPNLRSQRLPVPDLLLLGIPVASGLTLVASPVVRGYGAERRHIDVALEDQV
jgi:hypothetical protein